MHTCREVQGNVMPGAQDFCVLDAYVVVLGTDGLVRVPSRCVHRLRILHKPSLFFLGKRITPCFFSSFACPNAAAPLALSRVEELGPRDSSHRIEGGMETNFSLVSVRLDANSYLAHHHLRQGSRSPRKSPERGEPRAGYGDDGQ